MEDLHTVKIEIDDAALKAAGRDKSARVTSTINSVRLNKALPTILGPLGLDWYVGQGTLVITTKEDVARKHAGLIKLQQAVPALKDVEVDW